MKKNIKMIILTFLLLIVGIIIGVLSTYIILNTNKKEETPTIEKLSPEEVKEAGEEPGNTTPYRFFIEVFLYGNAEIVE